YEQVVGVNCTTPDLTYILALLDALDERVDVHVGGPTLALSAFALGANGYLSSEGNVAPRLCQSLVTHHVAGDLDSLHDAYTRVMRLFSMAMRYDHVCVGRAELELLGLSVGPPRLPRLPITDEATLRELATAVQAQGARCVGQLVHLGAASHSPNLQPDLAPSDVPDGFRRVPPHTLTREEIDRLLDAYVVTARRIRDAGMDGIEIH